MIDEMSTFNVEGIIIEVLAGYQLAHVRTQDGAIYGVNSQTPGVKFEELQLGQRVRLDVTAKFGRVLHAQLMG